MLQAIKQFFEQGIASGLNNDQDSEHALQLATSALLFEMMRMDDEHHEAEHAMIREIIGRKFSLSNSETEQLLLLAEQEATQSTDYHQFTQLINRGFSLEQKIKVVEHLWLVAYADGQLDRYEEHLVRKIAELLYVPHRAFIAAKHRAAAQA
jgi:uncharacterized tellurite resistance protein B-like protein